MALIKCSECHREISDRAMTCPHCGNPIISTEENPVTIQRTRKKWKAWKAVAIVMVIVGGFMMLNGIAGGGWGIGGFGLTLFFVGFITGIIGNIGAWWSNG